MRFIIGGKEYFAPYTGDECKAFVRACKRSIRKDVLSGNEIWVLGQLIKLFSPVRPR